MKLVFTGELVKGIPVPDDPVTVSVAVAQFKPGRKMEFEYRTPSRTRTDAQNRRYWKMIVPYFAKWAGYETYPELVEKTDPRILKNSAHRTLKNIFIGPRSVERVLPNGTVVTEVHEPSTAELTTLEMSELQRKAEMLLNENGIFLPEASVLELDEDGTA